MRIGCLVAAAGLYAYATVGLLSTEDPSGLLLLLAPVAWLRGEWLWQATSSDVLFVTTKRVFKVNSFLSKTMGAMPLRGLVDLTVHQPVLGRILGYGHLTFESAAQRQGLDKFHYVGDPLGVSKQIQARAYGGAPSRTGGPGGAGEVEGGDGVSDVSTGPVARPTERPVVRAVEPTAGRARARPEGPRVRRAQRADQDARRDRPARAAERPRGPHLALVAPRLSPAGNWPHDDAVLPSRCDRPVRPQGPGPTADPVRGGRRRPRRGVDSLEVDDQNFQSLLESSMAAPVVLVVYSPSRMPESVQLADDISDIADALEGRVAVGRVDIDAQPSIGQALQVPSVPMVALVLQGRLQPLFQEIPPLEELRAFFAQLLQQMTAQGITGRHEPFAAAPVEAERRPRRPSTRATPPPRTRSWPATSTPRWRSTRSSSTPAPPTPRPRSASRAPSSCSAPRPSTPSTARAAAADRPDDVEAQLLVADIDLLGGHVKDAFARLLDLVRRTSDEERNPGAPAPARSLRRGRQRRPARAGRSSRPGLRPVLTGRAGTDRRGTSPRGIPPRGRRAAEYSGILPGPAAGPTRCCRWSATPSTGR